MYWSHKTGDHVAEFSNKPFTLVKMRWLDCQYGKSYKKQATRLCLQGTRKIGCPAHIMTQEYEIYPEYAVTNEEGKGLSKTALRKLKEDKIKALKDALEKKKPISREYMHYVSLPIQ